MFSSRLPSLTPNAYAAALAAARASGRRLLDLTQSNPTAVGLAYPGEILDALADPAVLRYAPDPRGPRAAREAIVADYARRGVAAIDPDALVLVASTSEAYSLLFKLLCDPGQAVLIPAPSYPLFELLSRLEGIEARPYRLDRDAGWSIDRDSVERQLTADVRAILVVSPNNPTGSILTADDRDWLTQLAADRKVALIADEVFADYPLKPRASAASLAGDGRALTFALGGLSKSAGLPQVKLAWMLVSGPEARRRSALERLDVICDTYLSVSASAQVGAARLMEAGASVRGQIAARASRNLDVLAAAAASHPAVTFVAPEAGWSAILRVPAVPSEEQVVRRLLEQGDVIVYPGMFFDFAEEAFLVLSLLPEPGEFREGVSRLLRLATDPA